MMDIFEMDTVFWSKFRFDLNGGSYPQSKIHFTDDSGKTTLCGTAVPTRHEADVEGYGERRSVECKKCQKKYDALAKSDAVD